jgi:flagellar motility protein MotE (MotC chaperone)
MGIVSSNTEVGVMKYKTLVELLEAYKKEESTDEDVKAFSDGMYNSIKKQVLQDAEKELGGTIDEIQKKITELESTKAQFDELPSIRKGYEDEITKQQKLLEDAQARMSKLEETFDEKYKNRLQEKDRIVNAYKDRVTELQGEINNRDLEHLLKGVAKDLQIAPDCIDDFVEDIMLRGLAFMEKKEDGDEYIPSTIEFTYVENDVQQKSSFTDDTFGTGIKKLYDVDRKLKKYFPQKEASKGGSGIVIDTNKPSEKEAKTVDEKMNKRLSGLFSG